MAESHVVTGLVGKRAQLAGRIAACRRELEHLEADVGHLDGAIKLFAPDYKLETDIPHPLYEQESFFCKNENKRLRNA